MTTTTPAATKAAIALSLRADAAGPSVGPLPPPPPSLTCDGGGAAAAPGGTPRKPHEAATSSLATLSAVAPFYARALAPTSILVLWMFTIYAALAYVVPHVLCADTVSALPV